jgi:aldehyde:ferredoxin oxidoreductase
MNDFNGTILRVDVSSGRIEKQQMRPNMRRDYAGGRGINSRILFDEVGPGIDPLSPDNRLIFASGPLSGTAAPSAARFTVTAKSPLTGILGDANAGGRFGPAMKRAGIDHIVVQGRADKPVYLWINDDRVELRPAGHLWGKNVRETEAGIKEELGDHRVRIAAIGQAGENLVRIASITHEDRSASRTGVGAVMGSKNLKAVAVRGTQKVRLFDPAGFNRLAGELNRKISKSPAYAPFRNAGGIGGVVPTNQAGFLAVRNFQQAGEFEAIDAFDAKKVVATFYDGSRPCHGCPIGCGNRFRVKEGPYAGEWGYKIEEGAFTPLGPVCGNGNIGAICKMNNMANHYGIDLIEFGQGMAVVMEWYEKGIVSARDLDGIAMTWGNHAALMQMMEKVAFRQGVGDVLSEGIVRAAPHFGKEAEKYVSHCKGMVMAGIDIRMLKGTGLGFATSTRGSDHLRCLVPVEFKWFSKMTPEEAIAQFGTADVLDPLSYNKAAAEIYFQNLYNIVDLMEVCRFAVRAGSKDFSYTDLCELYSLATGFPADERQMMAIAERVQNVERAYLCRHGIRRKDDRLIGKWADEPVPNGPHKGERIDPAKWDALLDDYYRLRGWTDNGVPSPAKLGSLGLDDVARELDREGCYQ